MSQSNRSASRRMSRARASQRHRALRIAAVGVLSLSIVAIVSVVLLNLLSDRSRDEPATWSVAAYSGGPRLAVDRTLVDEGSVPYNHEVKATYRLKNVGDQPLTFQTPTVDIVEGC